MVWYGVVRCGAVRYDVVQSGVVACDSVGVVGRCSVGVVECDSVGVVG